MVNKVIGLWLTIGGALVGGALMRAWAWRALMLFGILQAASNLGFWWLAGFGKGALPGITCAGLRLGLRRPRRSPRRWTAVC